MNRQHSIAASGPRADDIVERAIRVWAEPLPDGAAAIDRFREVYIDPIPVNGALTELHELVDRARMLQRAIEGLRHDLHEVVATAGRRAIAFTITGRHTGDLATPIGTISATNRPVAIAGIDIFTIDEHTQRITGIWAVADWVGLLLQTSALPQENTDQHTDQRP